MFDQEKRSDDVRTQEKRSDDVKAQERLADDVETEILRTVLNLNEIIRVAAQLSWQGIIDRNEGMRTDQVADLAYTFACLEGARRGVLPSTPPPTRRPGIAPPPKRPGGGPHP